MNQKTRFFTYSSVLSLHPTILLPPNSSHQWIKTCRTMWVLKWKKKNWLEHNIYRLQIHFHQTHSHVALVGRAALPPPGRPEKRPWFSAFALMLGGAKMLHWCHCWIAAQCPSTSDSCYFFCFGVLPIPLTPAAFETPGTFLYPWSFPQSWLLNYILDKWGVKVFILTF